MHISVKVTAGAKRETVKEIAPHRFAVSVREAAEHNMANKRVLALIAAHYGVGEKQLRIIKGHRSSAKLLSIVK